MSALEKKILCTESAPAAIGPYSQGVAVGPFYFFSGMLGIDPATGDLAGDTAVQQAEQAVKNIRNLLAAYDLTPEHVVKTTVFLKDLGEFGAVNTVYATLFPTDCPARSCVEVARLPKDALVEIECIAVKE